MKRKNIILPLGAIFLAICTLVVIMYQPNSFASLALEDETASDIAAWMEPYGTYRLSAEIQEKMHQEFPPITVNCGEVTVTVSELLYDGEWMYTAAKIVPNDTDEVLVLPGGAAQPGDRVCGVNGEDEREDTRTFQIAAQEDGKQLLAVYVYPKEFDALGTYFLDYFQKTDDISVLLSGAQFSSRNNPISITWQIQIYDVDLDTQQYTLLKSVVHEHVQLMSAIHQC